MTDRFASPLHKHELVFIPRPARPSYEWYCDGKIVDPDSHSRCEAPTLRSHPRCPRYRCDQCDFDLCSSCFHGQFALQKHWHEHPLVDTALRAGYFSDHTRFPHLGSPSRDWYCFTCNKIYSECIKEPLIPPSNPYEGHTHEFFFFAKKQTCDRHPALPKKDCKSFGIRCYICGIEECWNCLDDIFNPPMAEFDPNYLHQDIWNVIIDFSWGKHLPTLPQVSHSMFNISKRFICRPPFVSRDFGSVAPYFSENTSMRLWHRLFYFEKCAYGGHMDTEEKLPSYDASVVESLFLRGFAPSAIKIIQNSTTYGFIDFEVLIELLRYLGPNKIAYWRKKPFFLEAEKGLKKDVCIYRFAEEGIPWAAGFFWGLKTVSHCYYVKWKKF